MLLPPQVGTELTHRLVTEEEAEGINDVDLLDGFVLVGISKTDTVVMADIGLVGIGGHSLDFIGVIICKL